MNFIPTSSFESHFFFYITIASIPSRDGLLTMLAGGMIQYVKELSIGLNMYAEQLEK